MAKHIETRGSLHSCRHCPCVKWIADSEGRLQVSVRNTSLGSLRNQVEDGGSGCLASGTRGGRDGDERLQRLVNRPSLSKRRIHKVEEIGIRVCCIEVHELGCVNDGASTNREERVEVLRASPSDSFLDPRGFS